ncbi:MAG: TadE/TadG family type IV pilus assembly protein [Rubripirellula sp.]
MMNCSSKKQRQRRGASAIEFALIAPLMIMFTFGLVELGRMMLVKQTATHATREGARVAVRPTADRDEVIQRVEEELALLSITGATIETIPASLEDAEPGSDVTIRVSIDIGAVSWIPDWFEYDVTDIVAESCMRRESTD